MIFYSIRFTVIVLFSALIVVQNVLGLIVLRHESSDTRNLTCVSEDDGSALIWNYNYEADPNDSRQDFVPRRPLPKKVTECAIWNSEKCITQWGEINEWDVVNSATRPMGPVFDHRWEGFKEFSSHEFIQSAKYQYVGRMNKSSDAAVFSIRGLQDVYIFLCETEDPMEGPCIWISLGKSRTAESVIKSCPRVQSSPVPDKGVQSRRQSTTASENCKEIDKEFRGILDPYEWRTFTIKWNANKKTIEVFESTEIEPFLQGKLDHWHPVSHISIKSDIAARVRFHFYEYFTTESNGAKIYTADFNRNEQNFCAELMVGLCPKCKLNFNLVDSENRRIEVGTTSGNENSLYNGMLTWRLFKLNVTTQIFGSHVKLEIETILNGDEGIGQWAIDSFYTCRSDGGLRKSTITTRQDNSLAGVAVWRKVNCQKLSYSNSAVVDSVSTKKIDQDSNQLQRFICKGLSSCGSSCTSLRGKWSICNPTGCTNDRKFLRSDCNESKVTQMMDAEHLDKLNLAFIAILPGFAICIIGLLILLRNCKIFTKGKREVSYVEPNPPSLVTFSMQPREAIYSKPILRPFQTTLRQSRQPSYLELNPKLWITTSANNWTAHDTSKVSMSQFEEAANRFSNHIYTLPNEINSRSVKMEYFEEYAKKADASGLLYSQFRHFRRGLTRPCKHGRLPENLRKNRDRNLIPYDDTRVILKKIPGDPHSDYINASYIQGYNNDRAYIATQGPRRNTVNDFWKMIWQERVHVISMLTNVVEGTEIKCEEYWPDVGDRLEYGDLLISNTNHHRQFADFTVRTFELSYNQHVRKITHLHYTGWRSCGLPTNRQSLVAYLMELQQTATGNGPVVVHCCTGNDRTGTLILCDICLRQAAAKKVIDVVAVTTRMRNNRANMVGTLRHYRLAHAIITEGMEYVCTDSLADRIKIMRKKLPFDIQRLNNEMWHERALHSSAAIRSSTWKDLANDKLPEFLSDPPRAKRSNFFAALERQSIEINAVDVDGFRLKKQYVASWLPSPFTMSDFWRFIAKKNIQLVIILQCFDPRDPTCCDIMPDESIVAFVPHIQVENKTSLDEAEYFTNERLLLTDTSKENSRTQSVTVLTCKGWEREENGKPPPPEALVSLWRAVEKIPREEGQSLVLCHDGITGCGLYLAMSFLLERMVAERECDVIGAVRAVRRSRPEFVQSLKQFDYLYDAAMNYVKRFQTYDDIVMRR